MTRSPINLLLLIAFASLLVSCDKERTGVFSGIYCHGFESMNLLPDDSDERWWVQPREDAFKELYADYSMRLDKLGATRVIDQYYRVTARGKVSKAGDHGHLGTSSRNFEVYELISFEWIESESTKSFETDNLLQKKRAKPEPFIDHKTGHTIALLSNSETYYLGDGRIVHIGEDKTTKDPWFYIFERGWFKPLPAELKEIQDMHDD